MCVSQDGGCTCPGDVAKAFGAGADFVMAGGMFAGHDQCGGEVVTKPDGKKVKLFYGMSSSTAMMKHSGKVADYRSSEGETHWVGYPLEGKMSSYYGFFHFPTIELQDVERFGILMWLIFIRTLTNSFSSTFLIRTLKEHSQFSGSQA